MADQNLTASATPTELATFLSQLGEWHRRVGLLEREQLMRDFHSTAAEILAGVQIPDRADRDAIITHPIHEALDNAIQHLKSDDGYEIIANGERWSYLLEAVLKASGMDAKAVDEAMREIEMLRA